MCIRDRDNNDTNEYVDCEDFGCSENPSVTVCPVENTDALCSDGIDNNPSDAGEFIDCDDFDCTRNPNVTVCPQDEYTFEDCTDGIDNDGNNHTDCDDFGCQDNRAACDYQPQD